VPSREVYSDLTFKELISLREELEFHTPPSVSEQSANPLLLNDLHPSILRPPCVRPASVSLDATGAYGPAPNESNRAGAT